MDQHLLALWNIFHMAMQEHSLHLNQISHLEPGLLCSERMNQRHLAGAGQTSAKGAANVATPNNSSSVLFFCPISLLNSAMCVLTFWNISLAHQIASLFHLYVPFHSRSYQEKHRCTLSSVQRRKCYVLFQVIIRPRIKC